MTAKASAEPVANAATVDKPAKAPAAASGATAPGEAPERTRKRRRRRRGKRVDGVAASGGAEAPASAAPSKPATRHAHAETFLAKLKSRIKTIFNRLPGRSRSR
jgi:ATP-dependent RNA helicase RhlB